MEEEKQNPTKEEFVDSLPNSKIDTLVKIRKTKADPGIAVSEDRYPTIREAYISGEYKTKTAFCERWGITLGTLRKILDVTGGVAEANRAAHRAWAHSHPQERKEYNQDPDRVARRKLTRQRRIENKKRIAMGLEPIKYSRKKPDRNWRNKDEKSE